MRTIAVVLYCPTCDYHIHLALPDDAIGTHLCIECDHGMDVYLAQGSREAVQWHARQTAASPVGDETPTKTAAQLLREVAAADPAAHNRALARGYGVGDEAPQPTCDNPWMPCGLPSGHAGDCSGPVGDVTPEPKHKRAPATTGTKWDSGGDCDCPDPVVKLDSVAYCDKCGGAMPVEIAPQEHSHSFNRQTGVCWCGLEAGARETPVGDVQTPQTAATEEQK